MANSTKTPVRKPWYTQQWFIKFKKYILNIFIVWIIGATCLIVWYEVRHAKAPTELGVSFSTKYAGELGIDWKEAYIYTIDNLDFKYLRLMSYWDTIEPEDDKYTFEELDWQMDMAAQYGVKVNLALGERQPRWPECHHPRWVNSFAQKRFDSELLEYMGVVVQRYKNHPALEEYQLENEYFNNLFGECRRGDRERLQEEFNLVKSIDDDHPVVINVSNQSGTPYREPVGDKVGFSMYRKAFGQVGPFNWYFTFWIVPPYWHTLRAAIIELVHDIPTFVHELQTEPWGPGPTVALSIEEQNKSMTPEVLRDQIRFAEQTGMSRIYIWGTEWWYWRLTKFNDPSLVDTVRDIVAKRNAQLE
jgi:hypothetical protein